MIKKTTITFLFFISFLLSCSQNSKQVGKNLEKKIEKLNFLPNKTDKIIKGDITLKTQIEIDNFGKNNYTFIDGNLIIGNYDSIQFSEDIYNLNSLKSIEKINGELLIIRVKTLESVSGLINLEKVNGNFTIAGCGMTKIESFNKIVTVIGDVIFGNNYGLIEVSGFNSVSKVKSIYITGNNSLKTLDCFNNIEEIEKIYVSNTKIENFSNFKKLKTINEKFSIEYSENLSNIFLQSLEVVKGYFALHENERINGNIKLPKLKKINHFYISSNKNFENYCDLAEDIRQNKIDSLTADFNKIDLTKEQVLEKCK